MSAELRGIAQLGIVTADIDRAVRVWEEKYGVGPWLVGDADLARTSATTLNGRPASFSARIAIAWIGPMMVELIEPATGESVWADSLHRHAGADHIHHVLCLTDDIGETIDDFDRKGVPASQTGHHEISGVDWAYFDTEDDLGFTLEFAFFPPGVDLPGGVPGGGDS